jgi:hypothetical protein
MGLGVSFVVFDVKHDNILREAEKAGFALSRSWFHPSGWSEGGLSALPACKGTTPRHGDIVLTIKPEGFLLL